MKPSLGNNFLTKIYVARLSFGNFWLTLVNLWKNLSFSVFPRDYSNKATLNIKYVSSERRLEFT